ncbi:hypothetical protein ACS0TY_035431 [Phlomoides rotata]
MAGLRLFTCGSRLRRRIDFTEDVREVSASGVGRGGLSTEHMFYLNFEGLIPDADRCYRFLKEKCTAATLVN